MAELKGSLSVVSKGFPSVEKKVWKSVETRDSPMAGSMVWWLAGKRETWKVVQ
jgi:hypothetical protein